MIIYEIKIQGKIQMKKIIEFTNVKNSVPTDWGDLILFVKGQPMSVIGYYHLDEERWYIKETDESYIPDSTVEWWAEYPTNFEEWKRKKEVLMEF